MSAHRPRLAGSRWLRILGTGLLGLLLLSAASCVTTVTGRTMKADKQLEVERRVEAANAYLKNGNTEKAVEHLRLASELDPNSATINATLAQVFWSTGEYELCEQHFRRAISIDPKFSRARNNYAAFLYDRNRIPDAIKQLELVIADTLYDGRSSAFINLGKAYMKVGRTAEAEEAFTRAVKMDRKQAQAMVELADMNHTRGEIAAAQSYYRLFRQSGATQSPRSLLLGIRLARIANDRDAEASYALQLKGLYPESAEYRTFLENPKGS